MYTVPEKLKIYIDTLIFTLSNIYFSWDSERSKTYILWEENVWIHKEMY